MCSRCQDTGRALQFWNCANSSFAGEVQSQPGGRRGAVTSLRDLVRKNRKGTGTLCHLCHQPAHLLQLQQRKGVCQQRHPEGVRSNVSSHQHQKQPGSFREPLLRVQPVEFSVLPYTGVLVKGKRRQCLSALRYWLLGGPFAPLKPVAELPPTEMSPQSS